MELSVYAVALVSSGIGIAGTLIGVLATYRLSIKLTDRQFQHAREIAKVESRHVSSRTLVEAFANDIRFLENEATEDTDVMRFLLAAFSRHSAAIANFEYFLSPENRRAFRSMWQEHCYGQDSNGMPDSPADVGIEHASLLYLHYGIEYNLQEPSIPHALAANRMRTLLAWGET